jgi:beta-glucosidase
VDDEITPRYPFGFGMSYTTFVLSNPRLESSTIRVGESTNVLVDVMNSGDRAGQEVVQLYIRDIVSSVTRPVKELKGFMKVSLSPGESKTAGLAIAPEHLSFTKIDKTYGIEPGDFEIMIGISSRDEDLIRVLLHVLQ